MEDLENGKLITSHDVQFTEDEAPSELASVNLDLPSATIEEVDELVDEAIIQDIDAHNAESSPVTPAKTPTKTSLQPPPAPKKTKKWEDLPR